MRLFPFGPVTVRFSFMAINMNLLLNSLGPWATRVVTWSGVAMSMAGALPVCRAQVQEQLEPVSCLLQVLDRVALPAERQGILETVPCRIGSPVESGQVVATLKRDKAELNLQRLAAELRRLQQAQDNRQSSQARLGWPISSHGHVKRCAGLRAARAAAEPACLVPLKWRS